MGTDKPASERGRRGTRSFGNTHNFRRTGEHAFVDQYDIGSSNEMMARAVRTTSLNHALGIEITDNAQSLPGKEREFLDRLMDPPWTKPLSSMLDRDLDAQDFGQATLVVDLAGYSRLCQVLPADILMVIMEKFHVAMFEISQQYGGNLIREPLGDATIHYFEDKNIAIIAGLKMQERMKSFIDDDMRQSLLRCGYTTTGFLINVAVIGGPVHLEISQTGPLRHTIFMGGKAYEKATKLLGEEERRGVVITEHGIVDPDEISNFGPDIAASGPNKYSPTPESIIAAVNLAVKLIRTTTLKPHDVVASSHDMAEVYTTIAALRLEDFGGNNVIADPTHQMHAKALSLLDHYCWKYTDTEVCKSGDKGELIVMNRSSKNLIKMCYELRTDLDKLGLVLQAGIFGGAFRAQSLYAKLSKFSWDVHSPAFASCVRAANYNKASGEGHIMIERRIADETPGLVTKNSTVEFHNMGNAHITFLDDVTDEIETPKDPIIGRDNELEAAKEFMKSGDESVMFFSGDPGMGKDRLLGEIAKRSREEGGIVAMVGVDSREYFIRDILIQLSTQSFVFQWTDEMRESKLQEFLSSPAAFAALLADHEISLKLFVPSIDKAPVDTLRFLSELVYSAKAGNFKIIANYNKSAFALNSLTSAGFGEAVKGTTVLGPIDESIVRDLLEKKIGRPLIGDEMEALMQEGICIPHVLGCLLPSLTSGTDIRSMVSGRGQSKGQVVQAILDKMLSDKAVSPAEKAILVDLSVFSDPINLELLVQFTDMSPDALSEHLQSLIGEGLVVKINDTYGLANSPLLPSLASFGLKRSAELHLKAGKHFSRQSMLLTESHSASLVFLEKAINNFAATGMEDDQIQAELESLLSRAINLAKASSKHDLFFHFTQMKRKVVEKRLETARNMGSDSVSMAESDLFETAYKEGQLAFYLGKHVEAMQAFEIATSVVHVKSPFEQLKALRDYTMSVRVVGEGDLSLVDKLIERMSKLQLDVNTENSQPYCILWTSKCLVMLMKLYNKKLFIPKSDLRKLCVDARDIYAQNKETLDVDDLLDLGILVVLTADKLRDKKDYDESIDLEIMREAIQLGSDIIQYTNARETSEIGRGRLTELVRAVGDLSVNILPLSLFKPEDMTIANSNVDFYVKHCKKVGNINNIATSHHARSDLLEYQGDLDAALSDNKAAIELGPTSVSAHITSHVNISLLSFKLGDYESAFLAATRALQIIRNHRHGRNHVAYYTPYVVQAYNDASKALGYENMLTPEEI